METSVSLLERLRLPTQEQAWSRFVGLYSPLLFCWARRMGCPEADAGDLVQDVLTRLVRTLPTFRRDCRKSFHSWLHTVMLNCWRNRLRRAKLPHDADCPDVGELACPDPTVALDEEEYRQRLVARALELMKAEFHTTTWKACWECTVNDRPATEVAAELHLSTGAVYTAKSRVLSRLREELAGLLD